MAGIASKTCRVACAATGLGAAALALALLGLTAPPETDLRQVLLIVVDTLRADRLGSYGYPRDTTPQLDAWAASGRRFDNALATSPWTLPSFASIYTGQYAARHGAGLTADREHPLYVPLDEGVPTIAERLQERGWTTAALVNNPLLHPRFGMARGFATYDYDAGDMQNIRRADQMVDRAVSWITEHRHESFLLVLHLLDPHMDYDAPPPFRGRFSAGTGSSLELPFSRLVELRSGAFVPNAADRAFIGGAYDEEVAFVDRQLGRLREALDRLHFLRRGLVVLTSDHGEELFDHDGFEHGHAMWQALLHVPLVVWGKGVHAGQEASPVSIADVAPTLLEFAGTQPPGDLAGVSLWPNLVSGEALAPRNLYAESILYGDEFKVVVDWPYKLVLNPKTGYRWMVDLEQDQGERVDLSGVRTEIADALTGDLMRRLEQSDRKAGATEGVEIDAETLKTLHALGYIQ